jgi:signal peptidase I
MTDTNQEPDLAGSIDTPKAKKEAWSFKEIILFIIYVVAIVLPVRIFIAQPFVVSGQSMDPTFANGQYLIVDQISYRLINPQRGDVVVFRLPNETSKFLIKRLIGLPGETVKIEGTDIFIKKTVEDDEAFRKIKDDYVKYIKSANVLEELGDDEYFLLGDNRANSLDSRFFGSIEGKHIIGRVLIRLFPFKQIDWMPGKFEI